LVEEGKGKHPKTRFERKESAKEETRTLKMGEIIITVEIGL